MQTGVGAPCLLGREGSPSGEADKPLQLETVRVNDLPLINMCALALTSRWVLGGCVLCYVEVSMNSE